MKLSTHTENFLFQSTRIHSYYTRKNGRVAASSTYYSGPDTLYVDVFNNDGTYLRTWQVMSGNLNLLVEHDNAAE